MFEYWMDVDLERLPAVETIRGRVFTEDSGANLIGVRVTDNGEPVTLSGTVKANIVKPDGTTITVTGSKSGNAAYVVLPSGAYALAGRIGVYLRLEDGGQVITLGGAEGYVKQSVTATTIS